MEKDLTISQLTELTNVAPRNAGMFLADLLKRKTLSENQAARLIGCAASTINRLVKGGDLTVDMAVKLHRAFGLSFEMLFALECSYKTHQAERKLKSNCLS